MLLSNIFARRKPVLAASLSNVDLQVGGRERHETAGNHHGLQKKNTRHLPLEMIRCLAHCTNIPHGQQTEDGQKCQREHGEHNRHFEVGLFKSQRLRIQKRIGDTYIESLKVQILNRTGRGGRCGIDDDVLRENGVRQIDQNRTADNR